MDDGRPLRARPSSLPHRPDLPPMAEDRSQPTMSTASIEQANPLTSGTPRSLLPQPCVLVGFGVGSKGDPDDWIRQRARDGIEHFSRQPLDEGHWADFSRGLFYVEGKFDDPSAFDALKSKLAEVDQQFGIPGSRIFYLSIPPQLVEISVDRLKSSGMVNPSDERS